MAKKIDKIRNGIIDRLLSISDKNYLLAIRKIVDNSIVESNSIKLTSEQKLMLEMSEIDIKNGNIISQNDLDKSDLEWLKGKQNQQKILSNSCEKLIFCRLS